MWQSIKTILNDKNSKCLIVEDNQPRYVVLTYEEYQHLQNPNRNSIVRENLDDLNGEIQDIRENDLVGTPSVKLEDLPF